VVAIADDAGADVGTGGVATGTETIEETMGAVAIGVSTAASEIAGSITIEITSVDEISAIGASMIGCDASSGVSRTIGLIMIGESAIGIVVILAEESAVAGIVSTIGCSTGGDEMFDVGSVGDVVFAVAVIDVALVTGTESVTMTGAVVDVGSTAVDIIVTSGLVDETGSIIWVNGNMGSGVTMLYPMSVLRGARSKSDFLGVAFAGPGQNQDTGHKVVLVAPETSANVRSKTIAVGGGVSTYRGLVKATKAAIGSSVTVVCDTMMLDGDSRATTIPIIDDAAPDCAMTHEATVGKIGDDQLAYLATRGLNTDAARRAIVNGFFDPIVKELPLEYAVEFLELVNLEMEGNI